MDRLDSMLPSAFVAWGGFTAFLWGSPLGVHGEFRARCQLPLSSRRCGAGAAYHGAGHRTQAEGG
ncbi:hypothetical protein [Nocardia terpenica]|uniref:hypothetical protein n=1 Tax=Nocardia terpenica TaxID=455432 RepID=UPI0012E889C1|nr:hypothetical protein [Nocardia terpenica]